ncbi:CDGSH iron-sulfur domain-containing protein [Pseudomonas sp. ZM23]|uniref:CDGSH iron-sulfur domain-containing protein n=1 Tax=Pseudomonas triclosanedens TaxID=2961893 RepID=A0ABY6ZTX1_9PSED|nr:CDGSH iron-sulfur domain-containing protein [Pseudomonas triclosanedens]MCP8463418.1 CDGSH iron-sulfur domain-containing protein [Pseudomonas triclosanedens]MCP8469523.1 CDGSH iron-sulfur domain-containing protein [Pseudomonas triclosanedens]MCP8474219.1 CDGSH iron-sulfur domain-containing protein [Pseudomonas triclosanedens]WAI48392.1 CDGSH iron-sulfur domain-containing protein [Pseudomonas triclosanedens]
MSDEERVVQVLPEVRSVRPGDRLRLCRCGRSACLPDCRDGCEAALELEVRRERHLLLCRCGRSARLPYCDGAHAPDARSFRERLQRFFGR